MGLEIPAFGRFGLSIAVNAFVGFNTDDRVVANNGTLEIGDFHGSFLFRCALTDWWQGASLCNVPPALIGMSLLVSV